MHRASSEDSPATRPSPWTQPADYTDNDGCEVCGRPEYHDGGPLGECGNCHQLVCGHCHVGGDDVIDVCRGCR